MEYEYETEEPRRQIEDVHAVHEIRDRLRHDPEIPEFFSFYGQSIDTQDLADDQTLFQLQQRELETRRENGLAVRLKDNSGPDQGKDLLVVVDLYGTSRDIDVEKAAIALKEAGLDFESLHPKHADEVFADRAAETIAMRAANPGGPGHISGSPHSGGMDTVSSRYVGDDIICAKGWFFSTRAIIGQSVCPLNVPPARYSLGVVSCGQTHFHPELWLLPVGRHIHLNLP